MVERILELLSRHPEQLDKAGRIKLLQSLGDLAYWWLRDEVLDRLPPEFRRGVNGTWRCKPGSCAILFAQSYPHHFPALRPAFLLPLRWCAANGPDSCLPKSLIKLAEQVSKAVAQTCGKENDPGIAWHLYLDLKNKPRVSFPDLAEALNLSVESGWGWLAAGLLLVRSARVTDDLELMPIPNPDVWITASWDGRSGFIPISLLEAKVACAVRHKAQILFVPESQVAEAQRYCCGDSSLRIMGVPEHTTNLGEALAPCLLELEVPPPDDAKERQLQGYFQRLAQRNRERAKAYYRQKLLPRIASRLKAQWSKPSLAGLVTILSDNPELIHLAIESTGAESCLILATQDKAERYLPILQTLRCKSTHLCHLIPRVFSDTDELLSQLRDCVHEFIGSSEPERVGLDLTPGTKEMTLTLVLEGAQPGNQLIYLRHRLEQGLVVPFSESWRLFPNPKLV